MLFLKKNQAVILENILNGSLNLSIIQNNNLSKQHLISGLIKDYLFIEDLTDEEVKNLKEFLIFCGRDFFSQYVFEVFRAANIPKTKKFSVSLNESQIEDTFLFINNNPEIKLKFIQKYGNDFKDKINVKSYFEITDGNLPPAYLFKKMYTMLKEPELDLICSILTKIVKKRQ